MTCRPRPQVDATSGCAIRRFASEDDVRYATVITQASAGTPEALALIRE